MLNLIVASKDDAASLNIATHLLQHYPFTETSEHYEGHPIYRWLLYDKDVRLLTVTGELVYRQDLTDLPGVGLIVFVSRHES